MGGVKLQNECGHVMQSKAWLILKWSNVLRPCMFAPRERCFHPARVDKAHERRFGGGRGLTPLQTVLRSTVWGGVRQKNVTPPLPPKLLNVV